MVTPNIITVYFDEKIECVDCPARVAICIPSSLILPIHCPDSETDETWEYHHIEATLLSQCYVDVGCGVAKWKLSIQYDGALLVEGSTLYPSQVYGIVCLENCLYKVLSDQIGAPMQVSFDEGSQVLTIVDARGCVTEIPIAFSELSIGTLDSEAKVADGAQISGSQLILQTADDSFPGLVSTGAQTFAGVKTFDDPVVLPNGNITFPMIQNIATDTLLGRDTAGAGAIEAILLANNLTFSGNQRLDTSLVLNLAGGTLSNYTVTLADAPAALYEGLTIWFRANHYNASPTPTLNVNALGAQDIQIIVDAVGTKTILNPGMIPAGHVCVVYWDGSDWILVNPAPSVVAWTPTLQAQGTTFSVAPTLSYASYIRYPDMVRAWGMWTGGTLTADANYFQVSAPGGQDIRALQNSSLLGSCRCFTGAVADTGGAVADSSGNGSFVLYRGDFASNWASGAVTRISFEVAYIPEV